jgi:hypothetical protein
MRSKGHKESGLVKIPKIVKKERDAYLFKLLLEQEILD